MAAFKTPPWAYYMRVKLPHYRLVAEILLLRSFALLVLGSDGIRTLSRSLSRWVVMVIGCSIVVVRFWGRFSC
jgi:hypothetical protein